jgi:hypothetical protein
LVAAWAGAAPSISAYAKSSIQHRLMSMSTLADCQARGSSPARAAAPSPCGSDTQEIYTKWAASRAAPKGVAGAQGADDDVVQGCRVLDNDQMIARTSCDARFRGRVGGVSQQRRAEHRIDPGACKTDQVQTIPRQGHQEAYAALLPVAGPRRAELATSKKSAGERWKTSACEWWAGGEGVRTIQYNFNCLPETIEHVPLSIPLSSSLLVMRSTASWWVAPDPP